MTNQNTQEENTLQSWATGKTAMIIIGLAVGVFLRESGMLQKLTGKLFSKKSE